MSRAFSVSQAMRASEVFNRLYVSMVGAGGAGILVRCSTGRFQIEKEKQIKRRVRRDDLTDARSVFASSSHRLLVPRAVFNEVFRSWGEVPILTRRVVAMSDLLRTAWFVIFPIMILLVVGRQRKETSPATDGTVSIQDPMRSATVVSGAVARFSRTLPRRRAGSPSSRLWSSRSPPRQLGGRGALEYVRNRVTRACDRAARLSKPVSHPWSPTCQDCR